MRRDRPICRTKDFVYLQKSVALVEMRDYLAANVSIGDVLGYYQWEPGWAWDFERNSPLLFNDAMFTLFLCLMRPRLARGWISSAIPHDFPANKVERKDRCPMKNVQMTTKNGKLIIEVDLEQEFGLSSSGKSFTIASTEGAISVPGREEVKVNLNVYRPKPTGK